MKDPVFAFVYFPSRRNSLFLLFVFFHFVPAFNNCLMSFLCQNSDLENIYCFQSCRVCLIVDLSKYEGCSICGSLCFRIRLEKRAHSPVFYCLYSYYSFDFDFAAFNQHSVSNFCLRVHIIRKLILKLLSSSTILALFIRLIYLNLIFLFKLSHFSFKLQTI